MNSLRSFGIDIRAGADSTSASRDNPGATRSIGPVNCSTIESAALMVRVTCGTKARIGSSTVSSKLLTRLAIPCSCSIVLLKFSTADRKSDTPRWNWLIDLVTAPNGLTPPNRPRRSLIPGGVFCAMAAP